MSGGRYDYIFIKFQDFAESLVTTPSGPLDPKRVVFQKILFLVSEAAHAIEWVDSGDYVDGREHEAIDRVMQFLSKDVDLETKYKAQMFDTIKELLGENNKNR